MIHKINDKYRLRDCHIIRHYVTMYADVSSSFKEFYNLGDVSMSISPIQRIPVQFHYVIFFFHIIWFLFYRYYHFFFLIIINIITLNGNLVL